MSLFESWARSFPDGKRFLGVVRAKQSGDDIPVTVVLNWAVGIEEVSHPDLRT